MNVGRRVAGKRRVISDISKPALDYLSKCSRIVLEKRRSLKKKTFQTSSGLLSTVKSEDLLSEAEDSTLLPWNCGKCLCFNAGYVQNPVSLIRFERDGGFFSFAVSLNEQVFQELKALPRTCRTWKLS
ncbi:hypothetical protein AVEN_47416-1 [Araneus ventricosus]|uniref:Uncharacterized protein n=1 Tax=Araneus ventricosus TaxID=182803 RepID=A0A4Y2IUI8_ARAVE|nr:hypothetical protein AVEN_47416-1 [Araneus ventricosus]